MPWAGAQQAEIDFAKDREENHEHERGKQRVHVGREVDARRFERRKKGEEKIERDARENGDGQRIAFERGKLEHGVDE